MNFVVLRVLPIFWMVSWGWAGCASSGSPTGPTGQPGLVVRLGSGATALKPGERDTVRAFVRDASGRQLRDREIVATWSVDNASIIRLDGSNALTALSPGLATIRATAEGMTTSLAVTVVKDLQGVWTGFYKVEQCTRISGSGDYCRFSLGGRRFMRLELVQRGQQVSGQLSVGDNLGNIVEEGNVTGQVGSNGDLTLSGKTADEANTTEFSEWTSRLTTDGLLEGRCTGNRNFTNAFGPQVYTEEYRFTDLKRE
jgi:hypothetical protein